MKPKCYVSGGLGYGKVLPRSLWSFYLEDKTTDHIMYEVVVHGQLGDSNPALATPADEPSLDPLLVAGVVAVELDVAVVAAAGGGLEPALLTLPVLQPGLLRVVHQFALFLAYFATKTKNISA
jgi:hypothetical protein